jgi:hypothetical protein
LRWINSARGVQRQVASTGPEIGLSLRVTGGEPMQTRVRKFAHVLERVGLAMAGAASGLFVAALVGTSHPALTNQGFLLAMMIGGAVGYYLGIDTPPLSFNPAGGNRPAADGNWVGKIDTPELLSAIGTFLAAGSAFASVGLIVLRHDPHMRWIWMIMAGWVGGVAMQIIAGAIARTRS